MKIIDTMKSPDGNVYTLSLMNNGDYVISDSEGEVQELIGMSHGEVMTIWMDKYFHVYPEAAELYYGSSI